MMKLLALPPECSGGSDSVRVHISPDTWDRFDKTVCWLVRNGVPLEVVDDTYRSHPIVDRRGRPYAAGELVTRKLGVNRDWVRGAELSAEYVVTMPKGLR